MIDIRTLDIFQKFTGWLASIFFAAPTFTTVACLMNDTSRVQGKSPNIIIMTRCTGCLPTNFYPSKSRLGGCSSVDSHGCSLIL